MMTDDNSPREVPSYPIGSVDKALRLLVFVAEKSAGIRIGEASNFLGVAPSTAHRLLQMLSHHGFAQQNSQTKLYSAGPAIRLLQNSRSRVLEVARPVLEELAQDTRETVHLAVLEGNQSLTLMSVESPHLLRVGDRSGHTQPAYLGAMGKALLLDLESSMLEELFPTGLERGTVSSVEELTDILGNALRRGYTFQEGEVESGVNAVGVPVRGNSGAVQFAIGMTYPAGRITADQLPAVIEQVKIAAQTLTHTLQA